MKANFRLLTIFLRDLKARFITNEPSHLTLFITSHCNYRCRMCFYWQEIEKENKNLLTLEEFEKISQRFPSFTSVAITGGEPFLREDLVKIAYLFYKNCGVRSIFIPTNASLPEKIENDVRKLADLCPKTLITICLSLDGIGKDHDDIRGVKGAYSRFLKTLGKLKNLKKKYENIELNCSFTYTKDNQDKLVETYKLATKKLGIKNFNASLVRGNARQLKTKEIEIEKYEMVTKKLDRESLKKGKISKFGSLFEEFIFTRNGLTRKIVAQIFKGQPKPLSCLAGRFNLVITEKGDVYPCEMLGKKLGSLRESDYDIKTILNSDRAQKIINYITAGGCNCTHEFNIPDNILYSGKGILMLIREWMNLRFGRE